MKRVIYCLLITTVVVSMVLAGCAQRPTPAPPTKPAAPAAGTWESLIAKETLQKRLYGQASEGGAAYVRIGGLSAIISKYTDIDAALTVTAGLLDAVPDFNKGMIDYTDLSPTQPMAIYTGTGKGQTEKVRLRILVNGGGIASSYINFLTRKDSNIKTFADLKGKKICYSPGNPWALPMIIAVLKANNMTEKDVTPVPGDTAVQADWVIERKVDAIIAVLGTTTIKVQTDVGAYLIPMGPKEQAEIGAVTEYVPGVIPKGLLGCTVDTPSVQSPLALWFRAGVNNITAYTVAKTFWEHVDEYYLVQDKCKGYTPENNLMVFSVPWHPGAIKYYQERGWWKAEHTKQQQAAIDREMKLYGDVPDMAVFKVLGIVK